MGPFARLSPTIVVDAKNCIASIAQVWKIILQLTDKENWNIVDGDLAALLSPKLSGD